MNCTSRPRGFSVEQHGQMSDEVGTNLVGAGQLVTCGDGYSPRVIAARRRGNKLLSPLIAQVAVLAAVAAAVVVAAA